MRGVYFGGYPWKDGGIMTSADINAAVALALSPVSIIEPGAITNVMLANPYITIGTTQINLGSTVLTLHGVLDPVNDLDVANKHYVDQHAGSGGGGGGIPDAPADASWYGRHNSAWAQVVPIAGGVTITGVITHTAMLTANLGLTVNGGATVGSGGLVVSNGALASRTTVVGLPPTSGSAVPPSLTGRFFDSSGPTLDFGSNGVSGLWLNATNSTDLSQRYPLLLQPLGGDTRMGGNILVTGSISGASLAVTGAISAGSLTLGVPLGIASGGTNNAAQALPPNLPGIQPWVNTLELSSGTQLISSNGALGFWAKTQGSNLYGVGVGNSPGLYFIRLNGTIAAPTPVAAGDSLGGIFVNGYDGSTTTSGNPAAVQIAATGAWSPTNHETELLFWTTAHNFTNPVSNMILDGSGNLTIQGYYRQAGPYLFLANGTGTINGTGGPLIYADTANMVLKVGSANGAVIIQNYAGTNQIVMSSTGAISAVSMALTGNLSAVNLTLTGSGTNVLNVTGGGITVQGGVYCTGINTANGGVAAGTGPIAGGSLGLTGNIITSGGYIQSGPSGNTFTGGITATSGILLPGGSNLVVGGTTTFNGQPTSNATYLAQGAGAGYSFIDRSSGRAWTLYGNGDAARINASGVGDVLSVASNGAMGGTSLQLNGGGNAVLNVVNGGISVSGGSTFNSGINCQGISTNNGGVSAGTGPIAGGSLTLTGGIAAGSSVTIGGGGFVCNTTGTLAAIYAPYAGGDNVFFAANGAMMAGAFNVISDASTKENIADSDFGLAQILDLSPKVFNRIVTPERAEHGLIAQEVAAILPHAVVIEREDKRMAIDYAPIVAALINAVKTLTERVATLENPTLH